MDITSNTSRNIRRKMWVTTEISSSFPVRVDNICNKRAEWYRKCLDTLYIYTGKRFAAHSLNIRRKCVLDSHNIHIYRTHVLLYSSQSQRFRTELITIRISQSPRFALVSRQFVLNTQLSLVDVLIESSNNAINSKFYINLLILILIKVVL